MTTPEDVVVDFLGCVFAVRMALQEQFGGVSRESLTAPLTLIPLSDGPRARSGHLEGVGDFQLHGMGCRVEFTTGELVDFDWDKDGREIFDAWRLASYARSRGFEDYASDRLVEAARSVPGVSEVAPGWYSLVLRAGEP